MIRPPARPRAALDLGSAMVRGVEIGAGQRVRASAALPRREPGSPYSVDELRRTGAALRRLGVTCRSVEVTLPREMVKLTPLELPPASSGAPLLQIARTRLAHEWHVEPDSFELALWNAGEDADAQGSTVAATCDHESAGRLIGWLRDAGFEPVALRPTASALALAADRGADEWAMVLDAGYSAASLAVTRRGAVLFERSLSALGMSQVIEALAEDLDGDHRLADWVLRIGQNREPGLANIVAGVLKPFGRRYVEELNSSLAYIRRCWPGASIDRLLVAGGGGDYGELVEYIGANLDLPACGLCLSAQGMKLPAAQAGVAALAGVGVSGPVAAGVMA